MLYKDINLLPGSRKNISPTQITIYVLLGITFVSYFAEFGVYDKLKKKADLEDRLTALESNVAAYGNTSSHYYNLVSRNNDYKQRGDAIENLLENTKTPLYIIDTFLEAKPEGVTVSQYNFSNGSLSLSCEAETYDQLCRFIDNLKAVDYYRTVTYSTIVLKQVEHIIDPSLPTSKDNAYYTESYSFNVSINYQE